MGYDPNQTTEYPIETAQLRKGDVIGVAEIERAFGVKNGTDRYNLALLRIGAYVTQRFVDRGEVVTVICDRGTLRILTDPEASEYNAERFWAQVRGAGRAHVRQLGVDRSRLDEHERTVHDRSLVTQGAVLSAIGKAQRELEVGPTARVTPLPPGAKED